MKIYLIQLNRPVLIDNSTPEKTHYDTLYGFIYDYPDDYKERMLMHETLRSYIGYVAATHEWSNNKDFDDYTLSEEKHWVDREGNEHFYYDPWCYEIGERSRKKLGLDYTLYVVDIDDITVYLRDEGMDGHMIITQSLMDKLVKIGREQNRIEQTVCLFNRPIWLPKSVIWEGNGGYCLIYGTVSERPFDFTLKSDINNYLGYLALCEEYAISGTTPSGFTSKDYVTWYKNGTGYDEKTKEIKREGQLCRNKYNLKICTAVLRTPTYEINEGVWDGLIIDQKLYEQLIDIIHRNPDVRITASTKLDRPTITE